MRKGIVTDAAADARNGAVVSDDSDAKAREVSVCTAVGPIMERIRNIKEAPISVSLRRLG